MKSSPRKPAGERGSEPTPPVRGRLTSMSRAAAAASPARGALSTPKKTPTRAAAAAATVQMHRQISAGHHSPARTHAPAPAPVPAASSVDTGRVSAPVSISRQREAHALGLRLRNLLKLPKAHKFVCYEWFYSTIDE